MAGYRITYDGSNVDRRDVPQATSSSSLTNLSGPTNVAPASWEFNGSGSFPWGTWTGNSQVATGLYGGTGATSSIVFAQLNGSTPEPNTVNILCGSGSINHEEWWVFDTGGIAGTYEFQSLTSSNGSGPGNWNLTAYNSSNGVVATNNQSVTFPEHSFRNVFGSFSGSLVVGTNVNRIVLLINNLYDGIMRHDYIRILRTSGGPVTITPTTTTQGVAPSGTTGVVESVTTDTQGQAAVAGPPKDFGINVIHNASTIAEAGFLPSAQNTEDASKDVATSKIITATDTSVTVEAFGLGGAEKLAAGETKIVVEDLEDTTEN